MIGVEALIFSIIAAFLLGGAACFWFFESKKLNSFHKKFDLDSALISSSPGGYVIYDIEEDKAFFSVRLYKILNRSKVFSDISEFISLFKKQKSVLEKNISQLQLKECDNFKIFLEVRINSKKKILCCTGNRVDSIDDKVKSVILWFVDVTEHFEKSESLASKNSVIENILHSSKIMLDSLSTPIWKRGKDYSIEFTNEAYKEFFDDDLLNSIGLKAKEFLKNHNIFTMNEHIIVNGKRKLFEIVEKKTEDGSVGFARDITDYEELERDLLRHVSAHSELLESSSSATVIYGSDMHLKFYNNAFVKLWGFKEEWLDENPSYTEVLENLRQRRKLPEQSNFAQFRKEQLKMFKDLISPHDEFLYLPDGKTLRVIVIPHALGGLLFAYEDITNRLAMERSYNTLIAVQKETLDNLSEGIAVYGPDGRLELYNPIFMNLLGIKGNNNFLENKPHVSELIDLSRDFYVYKGPWEKYRDMIIAETTGREVSRRRIELVSGKFLDRIVVPLPDGANLVSLVDITDTILVERSLRERNEALEEADHIKTEFLASVSYELRTPLTSIMGFSEALEEEYFGKLNKQQKSYVRGIYDSSNQLMSLINDILDLSSIEAGYMKLSLGEFSIYKALYSIVKLIQERGREAGLSVTLKCSKRIDKIVGDERRIKQVVFNLLSNAIKFTDAGGEIIVGASDLGQDEVVIWVEDNGIGISDKDRERVFSRFYKVDKKNSDDKSGAGLGLSMVKSMVELHGGRVEMDSKVGEGTKVSCYFKRNNPQLIENNIHELKNEV
ncbi:ATP-binding protein [Rickettsiales bacterium]|nr:ATP-binding protein [Rickettsiales bacterium]